MRTDSTNLSKVALASIASVVEKKWGKKYLEFRSFATKSKNAQEAHEAIRPSHIEKDTAGLNDEQKKLYQLIWARTVASQMADAEMLRTKIISNIKGDKIPDFAINGSRVLFPGWLEADPGARGEDVELPKLSKGDDLDLKEIKSEEKATQPPPRYSEAGLVKELEKRGIGRPSTYAAIIRTLEEREYVTKENKALKPTDTGDVVSTFLEDNFMQYINDSFTAEMEDSLDEIANGTKEYLKVLKTFYGPFLKDVKSKEKTAKLTTLGDADAKFKCPKCVSSMVVKLGRGGKFLSCDKYPDCDGALMIDGTEIKKDEPIGHDPETKLPIYVLVGRFGPYVQLGEKAPKKEKAPKVRRKKGDPIVPKPEAPPKPRMASIPKGVDLGAVSMEMALKYLSLPRVLGNHPITGLPISANIGRFGPYIVHEKDFRSLKVKEGDEPYGITFERAVEILSKPKAVRKGGWGARKKKE